MQIDLGVKQKLGFIEGIVLVSSKDIEFYYHILDLK